MSADSRLLTAEALRLRRGSVTLDPWLVGAAGLGVFTMALRLAAADQQSAYMDEGTNVLTGRLLIEQHAVYAEILNWAYGSYLWPLVAGAADEIGGLQLVRAMTGVCGVLMALATGLAAYRLAPAGTEPTRRKAIALIASASMAIAPTAIAVGRFGTYDAMAGAGFMLGVTLLVPVGKSANPVRLLAAAALMFVAFLAKYLVAIYFPFVCIAMVLGVARHPRAAIRNIAWFVLPLTLACAAYLLVYLGPLLNLLSSSMHYGDLKSPDPLREYVWERPEMWLLVAAAGLGWRHATWAGRLLGAGGAAIIMLFQLQARPDFDFWKHSIYVVYFLAPIAALSWLRVPQNTGTWRVLGVLGAGLAALWAWSGAVQQANRVINFYPNLNSSIAAIESSVAGSALVLTDDTALRYYLFPRMAPDHVVGPFFFTYRSLDGLEAYRRAVADRFFDAIVLDGGVTPQGAAIRQQLGPTIRDFYQRVYSQVDSGGFTIEIYRPVRPQGASTPEAVEIPWPEVYTFDDGLEAWGAHPEAGDWQSGLQVVSGVEQLWEGHPSLRFSPVPGADLLTLRRNGSLTRVRARIYLSSSDTSLAAVRIGFVGFDENWQWHDDGFRWVVAPGTWTTITWDLPPTLAGTYEEIGLKIPSSSSGVSDVYLGSFEILGETNQ